MTATDAQKRASTKYQQVHYHRYTVYIHKDSKYEQYMQKNTPIMSPTEMMKEYIEWKLKGGKK